MTDTQALRDLLVKVEAGNLPSSKLIVHAFGSNMLTRGWRVTDLIYWAMNPADIRGIGACHALHDAVLPDLPWDIWRGTNMNGRQYYGCNIVTVDTEYHTDPARAWLICIIRALIAQATP